MTATSFTGPLITLGNTQDSVSGTGSEQKTAPDAGPNLAYKGDGYLDVRYSPSNKERIGKLGIFPAFSSTQVTRTINAVPSTKGSTGNIAAAANVTNGTAMTLAAASAGIATAIPFLQFGTSTIVTANIALDMGFDSANVTSGSASVTVASTAQYKVGQPICIANVGNSGGTTALLTYITGITSATVFTVADKPLATNSATPIDTALPGWDNLAGLGPVEPLYCAPYIEAGAALMYDSRRIFSRGIAVTGVSGGAGGAFLINGYDGWGNPQAETITATAGATSVSSAKSYKYIQTITPQFTDAHNYSFNTIDTFGFPLYSQYFEETNIYWNAGEITANSGYTAGVTTTPATKTTGDPLGKYAVQSAADGTKRLVAYQYPSLYEMGATPSNTVPLFGVTPNAS